MIRRSGVKIGDRIRLVNTNDQYTNLKPGDEGTVDLIDDTGTIFAKWDNGSTLGLVPGVDSYEVITKKEGDNA